MVFRPNTFFQWSGTQLLLMQKPAFEDWRSASPVSYSSQGFPGIYFKVERSIKIAVVIRSTVITRPAADSKVFKLRINLTADAAFLTGREKPVAPVDNGSS